MSLCSYNIVSVKKIFITSLLRLSIGGRGAVVDFAPLYLALVTPLCKVVRARFRKFKDNLTRIDTLKLAYRIECSKLYKTILFAISIKTREKKYE